MTERQGMMGSMGGAMQRAEQTVSEYPFSAIATAFGVGLGLGVLLAVAMTEQSRPSASHWYDQLSAERLGRTMLDSLSSVLPDAVSRRIS
jgi:hypothetical protein